MIFKYITQCGNGRFFRSMVSILIFTFVFTNCGCYSAYQGEIRPNELTLTSNYIFIEAIMKNGLVINLRDKGARYESMFHSIIYNTVNNEPVLSDSNEYNKPSEVNTLKIKDIKSLIVKKEEVNIGATTFAVIGITIGVAAIIGLIIAASSCPFIYSFNGEKYIFDAEPYGGSVSEGLKKTDYSRLEDLKAVDGKYKLLMKNITDETQYTDELKLLVIEHPVNTEVAPDINGYFFVFKKALPPLSVTDESGKEVTIFFNKKDNVQWQTDLPFDTLYVNKKLKHELIIKFSKPKDAKKVKLLINAGTAQWGEYMIKRMLEYRGNKVDNWYEDIDKKGIELLKLYKFVEREELFIMNANVFENGKWVTRGTVSAGGPYMDEDRIVELNIENVTGDTLFIKLSPPYGYWKFDYAGAVYESDINPKITELSLSYAKNEKGQDLRDSLSAIDGNYYTMPDSASAAKLEFEVPSPVEDMNRSLYLKTTGYYEIHLKKDKPEQTELIEKIYNTPGLIPEVSMDEYIKKLKSAELSGK